MNNYFEQIMEFKGADELKTLVRSWDVLSDNISKRSFDAPIVLPDLFVYTQQGYGNTKLLNLLSEYLDSKENLMSFYGDVKFFEFELEYCEPDHKFSELYRLIDSIQAAAGFRCEFKGIIRINLDDWVGHHKEEHFLDFLRFLQSNTAYWMIFFTLSNETETEETKAMESIISMFLRIEKITLHMPSDEELVGFASVGFAKYGLELDEGAKKLLEESIAVLRKNQYFSGLRTISHLCSDIVYSVFSESNDVGNVITAEMLKDFSADSDYIKRTLVKIKETVTLGF